MTYLTHRALGTIRLTAEAPTTITDAETFYAIEGTFAGDNLSDFTIDTDTGILTYNGSTKTFTLAGSSNAKSDKNAVITYALKQNTTVVTSTYTPVTYNNANSYSQLAIAGTVTVNNGDTLQVVAKSDASSTTLTVGLLSVVFISGVGFK